MCEGPYLCHRRLINSKRLLVLSGHLGGEHVKMMFTAHSGTWNLSTLIVENAAMVNQGYSWNPRSTSRTVFYTCGLYCERVKEVRNYRVAGIKGSFSSCCDFPQHLELINYRNHEVVPKIVSWSAAFCRVCMMNTLQLATVLRGKFNSSWILNYGAPKSWILGCDGMAASQPVTRIAYPFWCKVAMRETGRKTVLSS